MTTSRSRRSSKVSAKRRSTRPSAVFAHGVRRFDDELLKRLEVGTSPVLVQAYVPGIDVRVHVADGVCLATAVDGIGVDYRFDGSRSYQAYEVPPRIRRLCAAVSRSEGLLLAGFDFRVCEQGWFCLEVNPMPSFVAYQWATGQPIAESVLQAFARASSASSP